MEVWQLQNGVRATLANEFHQNWALRQLEYILKFPAPLPSTRGWAGSPDFLLEIAREALSKKPNTLFECSCGTSTIVLARVAQLNGIGHVYSLENDERFANETRENLTQLGLAEFATVIHAPFEKYLINNTHYEWYSTTGIKDNLTIDLMVIDGPPTIKVSQARYPALPLLKDRLSSGALIFLDDAKRQGEVEIVRQWTKEFANITSESLEAEKGLVKLIWMPAR